MKHIVFIYGLCGIGKTSLLRTFGPRTPRHEKAPRIPEGTLTFAVDQTKGEGPEEKAAIIKAQIREAAEGIIAVDVPQMHVRYYENYEATPGAEAIHILLDENESILTERLLSRNPKRDIKKALKEAEALRRWAERKGIPRMTQCEIAVFLHNLFIKSESDYAILKSAADQF